VGIDDCLTRSPSEHSQAVAITEASTDSRVVRAPLGTFYILSWLKMLIRHAALSCDSLSGTFQR
jgi:hypothetical protein